MKHLVSRLALRIVVAAAVLLGGRVAFGQANIDDSKTRNQVKATKLRVLFIGNSYTARHKLAQVVKAMAEAGRQGLTFEPTTVIYGGRTLRDHWRLGTQNFVRYASVTAEEVQTTIDGLEKARKSNAADRYAGAAIKRQRELAEQLNTNRSPWDVVVLQSYRDDLGEGDWLYAEFAKKFAKLAQQQGARVVLYQTTPTTQNAQPLKSTPSSREVLARTMTLAQLANEVDARAAPMALIGHRCQKARPDLTLRFVNDAHLNQTMAYLTACSLYAAIIDADPQGLPLDSITDIRFQDNKDRTKDRDGKPITTKFSPKDRADLQRIAWEGVREFEKLRRVK